MEGNRGHRPLPAAEPSHPVGVPDCPERLSGPAKKLWDDLVPQLVKVGVLRIVDGESFAAYCEDAARLQKLRLDWEQMINETAAEARKKRQKLFGGPEATLLGTNQGWKTFRAMRDLTAQLIIQRREYGLTPSSNTRVVASKPRNVDSLETSLCG